MAKFADVIIDITHESVDRPFQYRIPEGLKDQIYTGCQVEVPFGRGNHLRSGYVVGLTDQPEYDPEKLKSIAGIKAQSVSAETQLIQMAWWMKERYGCTMNQALNTVLPVKQQVRQKEERWIRCLMDQETLAAQIRLAETKKYRARERLLKSFLETEVLPYGMAMTQLNLTRAALKPLEDQGLISVDSRLVYRDPVQDISESREKLSSGELVDLNDEQKDPGR